MSQTAKFSHTWIFHDFALFSFLLIKFNLLCLILFGMSFFLFHYKLGAFVQSVISHFAFWLTTECRSRAYAILICLSSSSSSLSSSVSTPPDHMLGQIRFILCMHMQLYPV